MHTRFRVFKHGAITGLALLSSLGCLLVLARRIMGAVSLARPLHVLTSSFEEESLLAFWNYLHGLPVYAALPRVPFCWSVYNWLYYVSYGSVLRIAFHVLGLSDAWLPTVARLFTMAGALCVAFLSFLAFSGGSGSFAGRNSGRFLLPATLALFIGLGPLTGFWALTARPDMWAFALEIGATLAFLRLHPRRPLMAVLAVWLLAYAAWSFKQASLTALAAIMLFLIARRRWRNLLFLSALFASSIAMTFLVGPELYRRSIILTEYVRLFVPGHSVDVFLIAARKLPAVILPSAAVALVIARRRDLLSALLKDDRFLLATCGVTVGVPYALITSSHPGASDNYWFVTAYFVCLFASAATEAMSVDWRGEGAIATGWGLGWALQSCALVMILTGRLGVLSVRPSHDWVVATKPCLDPLPRPLFVDDGLLSLPWLTPGSPPFVLGYGYGLLRRAGRPVEGNGIGGLIEAGKLAALALRVPSTQTSIGSPSRDPASRPSAYWDSAGLFDHGDVTRYYQRTGTCGGLSVYVRKP